jgi:cobalamin synthase
MQKNDQAHERKNKASEGRGKHDPHSGIFGGLILILLGVLFLLATMDVISWGNWWAYLLLGLGAIFIIEFIVRSATPASRQSQKGKLIVGTVLIIIGGAHILGMVSWWPLILIAVGIIIIFTSLKKA